MKSDVSEIKQKEHDVFCRECKQQIFNHELQCPHCGCDKPEQKWLLYGWEYKSRAKIFGIPLVHISLRYKRRRKKSGRFFPRPAVGIIAIGQFACGIITIAQFGIGLLCMAQFCIAAYAIAQITLAIDAIAQIMIPLKWVLNYFGIGV